MESVINDEASTTQGETSVLFELMPVTPCITFDGQPSALNTATATNNAEPLTAVTSPARPGPFDAYVYSQMASAPVDVKEGRHTSDPLPVIKGNSIEGVVNAKSEAYSEADTEAPDGSFLDVLNELRSGGVRQTTVSAGTATATAIDVPAAPAAPTTMPAGSERVGGQRRTEGSMVHRNEELAKLMAEIATDCRSTARRLSRLESHVSKLSQSQVQIQPQAQSQLLAPPPAPQTQRVTVDDSMMQRLSNVEDQIVRLRLGMAELSVASVIKEVNRTAQEVNSSTTTDWCQDRLAAIADNPLVATRLKASAFQTQDEYIAALEKRVALLEESNNLLTLQLLSYNQNQKRSLD
ncbi:hypothetical protein GQ42DRAFT_160314 [Ramicandelaber brevisporus]|nr:hypothetical protein GQ42DRAFT_160314 [Ramicandelaber brevisporus]